MSDRENLFRPIHKGIRLMLLQSGAGLQATSFEDVNESNRVVLRLKHDLGDSLSNCILCLLNVHTRHEEREIFSKVRAHDPDVVRVVMKEHVEVAMRIHEVSKTCDEVSKLTESDRRIEIGDRLIQEVNEMTASYLSHLNNEEALLVPVMWEWFTDEQLRAMRDVFYRNLPLPLFETWMHWTLPAMNQEELIVLFSGLKQNPESSRYKDWVRLAHETLDPDRWLGLRERVGVELPSETRPRE